MEKKFNILQLFIVSLLCLLNKSSISFAINYNTEFDDWIISSSCQDRTAKLCHGYYLEPEYLYPINEQAEYPTKITSDKGEFVNKKTSKFFNNVLIQKGNQQLLTDQATIIHNEETGDVETMHAIGNVTLTEPNLRIDGSKADIYKQEDRKVIYNSTYRMYKQHARGTSDSITITKDTQTFLPNASYTTCAPNSNTWQLKAKRAKFDKDSGRGETWHSWLYIKRFKVFYWPYLNFPIDNRRQTGFLMPSMHTSSSHGAHISTPYYLNLAPNYDAIITPHVMAKRGLKIDNHFRYLTNTSEGNIKFNFLPRDQGYRSFRNKSLEKNTNNIPTNDLRYTGLRPLKKRWAFFLNNKTDFNKQLKAEIDYTRIGDDNYIYDFDGDIMQQIYPIQATNVVQQNTNIPDYSATTAVRQKIELQYLSSLGTATSKLEQYQILHPFDGPVANETYQKLPELDFQSSTFDLPYDFTWRLSGNYSKFKMREVAFSTPSSTGTRYHFQPALEYPIITPGWFIKPAAQLDITSYRAMKLSTTDQQNNKTTQATRNVPLYNIDAGLIFERPLAISNEPFLQTLEPRAYYLYVPKREQNSLPTFDSAPLGMDYNQAFRNNRYSGFDRVGEANQLGFGVMSRFLTEQTNAEKASIGVSRILYFQNRINHLGEAINNTTSWSPIAATAKYEINPHWNVEGNLVKKNFKKTDSGSLTAQYITDPTHVINFGYQFTRNDVFNNDTNRPSHLRTIQLSSAWEIKPEVRLLGKLAYDLNLSRTTNVLLGLEHHSCCTIYRIVWMRHIKAAGNVAQKQYEHAISLQFVLKGLTQTGNVDTGKISGMIPGYVPKDNEF